KKSSFMTKKMFLVPCLMAYFSCISTNRTIMTKPSKNQVRPSKIGKKNVGTVDKRGAFFISCCQLVKLGKA
ncbi:hypothetical protein M3P05_11805, partial [Sansalvadorimonas sp. 2012CJ34-2]